MSDIIGFIICALIIFLAGKKLSYYGDLLAELTGMGKAWIGLILMASVTSLPELMVGISSSAIVESADLATGDIIGSCAFNLGILSLMDVFTHREKPLFSLISQSHILAAALGIILIGMVGLGLFLDQDIVLTPSIGITSLTFGIFYFVAVRTLYKYQSASPTLSPSAEPKDHTNPLNLKQVIIRYAGLAFIIIVAALFLPYFAEHIADMTGLGKSFVGTLFLAFSTSLPEIAVSVAALRMGAADMAVGNVLGSNIFNVFILFLDDLFYTRGHILKDASDANLLSVFFVILMSATAIIGFIFPSRTKLAILSWDTMIILLLYIVNMVMLYLMS